MLEEMGLNNQHEVGGQGWWRENGKEDDWRRGDSTRQRLGGNGGRGKTTVIIAEGAVVSSCAGMLRLTRERFQDLPHQTTMADPPLHGQEASGEGKTMQKLLYCSYLRQMGLHMPPWRAPCIRVKMGVEH